MQYIVTYAIGMYSYLYSYTQFWVIHF